MKVGIDIDGVLTNDDDYILDCAIKFSVENEVSNYVNPYDYETRKFDWDNSILEKYRKEYFGDYVLNEKPRRFASEVINKLKEEGNEIYIITSRHLSTNVGPAGDEMRSAIKAWLKKHDIVYDDIYFSGDKTVQIKELQLDVMIEDSPETIPVFAQYIPILCYDCRYNRHLKGSNIIRVFSWYDIYSKLKKMDIVK